jgi:mRNA interferase MazF
LKRGDLVTVALQGDQGKPRPALVVQADYFGDLGSVTVLPITSTLVDAPLMRVPVEPSEHNGLARRSQIMPTNRRRHPGPGWVRFSAGSMMRRW